MYGKHFSSLYTGSMVGAGAVNFAVFGYVIANHRPDRQLGATVELNPKLLAMILGEPETTISEAIKFLCQPDPKSRSKGHEGRRLIQLGEYEYQVVNGAKYRQIRDEDARREQTRLAMRRLRAKSRPLPGEREYAQAVERDAPESELAAIMEKYSYRPSDSGFASNLTTTAP